MTQARTHDPEIPAVRARGLVKTFGTFRAVDGVDLDIRSGEVFSVLGPNGAGKTTMIRMLATLLQIDAGTAEIFGVDVATSAHRVRQLIGLTGQYASVDEGLTGRENLHLFAQLQGMGRTQARRVAEDLLAEFALDDAADKALAKFSGGMRRRLDLAASLINRPPLIFLDEPTTGLDPRTRNQMWDTIRSLVEAGSTILLTTQYLEEADQLADRIAVIDHGRLIAQGTPSGLKSSIGSSSLQLVLTDPEETAAAHHRAQAATRPDAVHIKGPGELLVTLEDTDDTAGVLLALQQARIGLASMNVQEPSLDEVFLTLTSRSAPAPEVAV